MSRPAKGDVVSILFWDHAENANDAVQCTVYGKIANITKLSYIIDSWILHEQEYDSDNFKRWAIMKSAVIETKVLCLAKYS
jgi:hypothetical protein